MRASRLYRLLLAGRSCRIAPQLAQPGHCGQRCRELDGVRWRDADARKIVKMMQRARGSYTARSGWTSGRQAPCLPRPGPAAP